MKFLDYRNSLKQTQEQIILDKKVNIFDREYHFISIFLKDNKINLLCIYVEEEKLQQKFDYKTKKEQMISDIENQDYSFLHIEKLNVNGREFNECSGRGVGAFKNFYDSLIFNYAINSGIDLSYLDDIYINNIKICLYEYEQDFGNLFKNNDFNVSVTLLSNSNQVLVNKKIELGFNKVTDFYIDENNEKQEYTARLLEVDFWGETITELKTLSEKQGLIEQFNENLLEYENICPKGKNLLVVASKSENQLDFYSSEYLQSDVFSNNGHMSMLMWDDETNERYSILKPVHKGEVLNIEVELFSYFKKIGKIDLVLK